MTFTYRCVHCGNDFVTDQKITGRKVKCRSCGQIQRIASTNSVTVKRESERESNVYALDGGSPETPLERPVAPRFPVARDRPAPAPGIRFRGWRTLIRAGGAEASHLEAENLALIALSAADVLVTYVLLRRSPAFYESNPVAQWFFVRWNIAGMAMFKFSAMGLVVVIGEIVERHRPGWGRGLLLASCAATAAVVFHGLRLLFGHGDNGAPLN
jgi:DNA-directed RNA polymerase subunit RPC12/RpoP